MRATVIVYHGVGDCPPGRDPYRMQMPVARFRWQVGFLARRRQVVTLDAALRGDYRPGRPAVAVTFDDGYRSVLTTALPVLAEHGFPATCFVPTGWLARCKGWDPLDGQGDPLPIVDADDLAALADRGWAVESHGHRHARLDRMGYRAAYDDIVTSVRRLTEVTGRPPRYLAYPWGAYDASTRRAAAAAGLVGAFSVGRRGEGAYARERVTVRPSDGRALFAYKTSGRYLSSRESALVGPAYRGVVHPLVRWRRSLTR